MKRLNLLVVSSLLIIALYSCKKNDSTSATSTSTTGNTKSNNILPDAGVPPIGTLCNNYQMTIEDYGLRIREGNSVFVWKVQNLGNAHDLKQIELNFSSPDVVANIVSLTYGPTPEGGTPIKPIPGYGIEPNDQCFGGQAFTIKQGTPQGSAPVYYRLVTKGYFELGSMRAFLIPTGNGECCATVIAGVGNPSAIR